MVAKAEVVEDTGTGSILEVVRVISLVPEVGEADELGVRDDVPETGLLVAAEAVGEVPEEVSVEQVLVVLILEASLEDVVVLELEGVLQTLVTDTGTHGRSEPLTKVDINGEAAERLEVNILAGNGVGTSAEADEPVVPEAVGLIRTADNVAILVTVAILLRAGGEGESEESCYCKSSKNKFDTFHVKII